MAHPSVDPVSYTTGGDSIGHHITAEVADGLVQLNGTVRYPSDAQVAVSLVAALPGVIEVKHQLTAELSEPKVSYLGDTDWR